GIAEHHKDTIYGAATDTPVKEIWESAPSLLAQRQLLEEDGMKGICSICAFRGMCKGHCRAASVDAFGEVNAPYPFCQAAYDKGLFPEKRIAGDRTKADTWIGKQKVHGWA
nr:hypothetical protein [bacterium]